MAKLNPNVGHRAKNPGKTDLIRDLNKERFEFLERAVRIAEKREEFKAQNGPVRVLFKDGKPVNPDASNGN